MRRILPCALCLVAAFAASAAADTQPPASQQPAGPVMEPVAAGPTKKDLADATAEAIQALLPARFDQPAQADAVAEPTSQPTGQPAGQPTGQKDPPKDDVKPSPMSEAPKVSDAAAAWPTYEPCVHVYADYLLWWIRRGPTPALLTTTSDPNGNAILGEPGTSILFGEDDLDFGAFSGVRAGGGWNFGAEGFWGVEVSGFILQTKDRDFAAGPSGTGILVRPYLSALDTTESGVEFNLPGSLDGTFTINAQTQFWGWDANLVSHSIREPGRRFDLMAGFRALGLDEELEMQENLTLRQEGASIFQRPPPGRVGSLITDLPAGSRIRVFDEFTTRNRFYGGQVGGRFLWNCGRLNVELLGKVALGATQQRTTIFGVSVLDNQRNGHIETPGGLLALASNIGTYNQSQFGVVPEVGLNAHFDITPRIRARLGYSGLYWSGVTRPGDQIDRVINPKLAPTDQDFTVTGDPNQDNFNATREQARPRFLNRDNGFWAHGLNFGIEFRY
ncbi:MAG: BBP7 family outer membrane beta-barrel protein [Gemmataceae bacterium]|nr:BBP7 family outer membrane beta-barrel protein [Gemmataceae bacterium]